MKGVTLFADVISVLVLLAVIMISVLIIWWLILIRNVEVWAGAASPRMVDLTVYYLPAKYDAILMTFLESQSNGVSMKRALEAAAIQESKMVWLDGQNVDVGDAATTFLSSIGKPYILKIVLPNKEVLIANNEEIKSAASRPTELQQTSEKLFLLNGEVVDLELLVRDS
jgi:hypothetical protein